MSYAPDPHRYQQLTNGDPHGGVNCTAWCAAWVVDFHTEGTFRTTGTAVRRHSNEPNPDPHSPGLNMPQVDASVLDITKGKIDLDVHIGMDFAVFRRKVEDGRPAIAQVNRAVLVDHGYGGGSGFRGGHAITVHLVPGDVPADGDPLVPRYLRMSGWDILERACGALIVGPGRILGAGRVNAAFGRDITPDWLVRVPADTRLTRFILDKDKRVVVGKRRVTSPNGFSALCTPPFHVQLAGQGLVKVVTITSGVHAGWTIRAKWSEQVQP